MQRRFKMDRRRRRRIFGFRKKTEDEDEDSSEFWKIFEDRNFFEDIQRIEYFCQYIKENTQLCRWVVEIDCRCASFQAPVQSLVFSIVSPQRSNRQQTLWTLLSWMKLKCRIHLTMWMVKLLQPYIRKLLSYLYIYRHLFTSCQGISDVKHTEFPSIIEQTEKLKSCKIQNMKILIWHPRDPITNWS